jgi:RND family efflux transporter MFP subunit
MTTTYHPGAPPDAHGDAGDASPETQRAPGGAPPERERHLARIIFVIGLLLVVTSVLAVLGIVVGKRHALRTEEQARSAEVDKGPVVMVARATLAPPTRSVVLTGDVRGYFQTTLYAKVSGYVRDVLVDKGDRVHTGQILGTVESPETDQALVAAQASAALRQKLARRAQELAPNVVAEQDLETANSNFDVSKAGVLGAQALKQYEIIRAPFDGVVTARYVDPGALMPAATGGTQSALPFVDVGVLDTLRIDVYVSQDIASFVKPGDPVTLWQDQRPELRVPATVTRLAGALDPRTRTMLVEIQLDNREYGLLPGTFASVELHVDAPPRPTVPQEALIVRGGKNLVAKVVDGHAHLAEVEPGRTNGKTLEILRGVAAGDVVALDLPVDLSDGAAVQAQEKETSAGARDGGAPDAGTPAGGPVTR